jgi:hypothetical protein
MSVAYSAAGGPAAPIIEALVQPDSAARARGFLVVQERVGHDDKSAILESDRSPSPNSIRQRPLIGLELARFMEMIS